MPALPTRVLDQEHQALRHGLARLRDVLAAGQTTHPSGFGHQLEEVRRSLAAHFAFEENYGSLHYLVATLPNLQPRLDELHAEHREILVQLDLVLSRLTIDGIRRVRRCERKQITSAAAGGGLDPKLNLYTSQHDAINPPR